MMKKSFMTKGAALLLVLWAIAVISFSVLWLADLVNLELETGTSEAAGLRTRQIALSGVAIGMHPLTDPDDTELLNRDFGGGERMEVRIRSEGSRLNINRLLEQQDRITMKNLFMLWGLANDEADSLIDKLIDWVDGDDFRLVSGAERNEYEALEIPEAPANRPFRSVSEMEGVIGMDRLAEVKPDWAESFTIFGDGLVDVNEAPADILQAATGLSPEMVAGILQQRTGPDGIEPSEDDFRFEGVEQLAGWLQSSLLPLPQVMAKLSVDNPVKRIDSRGMVGDRETRISVVAQREGGGPTDNYLLWEEK